MEELLERIREYLRSYNNDMNQTGIDENNLERDIDRIVIKRLAETNTLENGKSGHQTHIAITGNSMNVFDTSEQSKNVIDLRNNRRFQKDFVVRNNLILLRDNFKWGSQVITL